MSAKDEMFERLREFLSALPSEFCLVYRRKMSIAGVKLKWCKAVSRDRKTHEEFDELAVKYQQIAVHCYQRKRNLILQENLPSANSRSRRWCGLNVRTEANENLPPANSLGQRWWHLVVGGGATRDAGYVIVTRIAAKEPKELHEHVAGIQEIFHG